MVIYMQQGGELDRKNNNTQTWGQINSKLKLKRVKQAKTRTRKQEESAGHMMRCNVSEGSSQESFEFREIWQLERERPKCDDGYCSVWRTSL